MSLRRCLDHAAALCVLVLSANAVADTAAEFSILWQDGRLVVSGDLSSEGHRSLLQDVMDTAYPEAGRDATFEIAITPPAWSLLTEQALRAAAATRHAEITISEQQVVANGERDEDSSWPVQAARLEAALLPGMSFIDNVAIFDDSTPFGELCRRQFDAALKDRRVVFRHSSAELSPASLPLLDALVEIASDCPAAELLITGHTDSIGDETFNQFLSEQRANAVKTYLQERGIAGERLSAVGAGSSAPLAESNTPAARARNRRIEFTWTMPAN